MKQLRTTSSDQNVLRDRRYSHEASMISQETLLWGYIQQCGFLTKGMQFKVQERKALSHRTLSNGTSNINRK